MTRAKLFIGSYAHSISLTELDCVERAFIFVSAEGRIEWIEKDAAPERLQELATSRGLDLDDSALEVIELEDGEFMCPGFIDTHTVS